ncbi:MAG: IS1182 family transposase [Acidimicrobiia bacterium]
MMGEQSKSEALFYYFKLEDHVPQTHLLRLIDRYVDFGFLRQRLRPLYSETGRPSVDPEVLLRMLLIGYLYGITSERRLCEDVGMHLAYRWFLGLGFDQAVPHHSTFSKNRHGRFKESELFRNLFEEIVGRCLAAGLVEGESFSVDGSLIEADAGRASRVRRDELAEVAKVSHTVRQYLAEIEAENPVSEGDESDDDDASGAGCSADGKAGGTVSKSDPDATWAAKNGPAKFAYYDNYLIDNAHGVIVGVEATAARFSEEVRAARAMLERTERTFGLRPSSLGADKAYGSGAFLAWLQTQGIQPHIPVIDRRGQTQGRFSRDRFTYDGEADVYICPEGETLAYVGIDAQSQANIYRASPNRCRGCPQKNACTRGPCRKLSVSWHEPARQSVRELAKTEAYQRSRRQRYKVERLFGELKTRINLRRLRLRRLRNASEQFLMAATAQNLKRLVKHLDRMETQPV